MYLLVPCQYSVVSNAEVNISFHVGRILPTRFYLSCRNIGQTLVCATLCCAAEFFGSDKTKPDCTRLHRKIGHGCNAMSILFLVPLITKNGAKSTYCMVRGKFLVSLSSKTAIFLEPCRNIYFS